MPILAPAQVLVVDDDPALVGLLAAALAEEGYRVSTAFTGAEALRAVHALDPATPACILLDLFMPELDGCGVARVLRARGGILPLLVMSGARDVRGWAARVGADAYLAKPFDLDALFVAVARLCAATAAVEAASDPTAA